VTVNKIIEFGKSRISSDGPPYFIAEIGHNHQGDLEVAKKMIKIAAIYEADAVKFQKRNNKNLFTKAYYNRLYDNENSFGNTYGEHREFLEFGEDDYKELMKCARENNIEFICTAFDKDSIDFLENLGINSFKFASGDLTNLPLLEYVAKLKKPLFISTGASTLEEIKLAYETVSEYTDKICLLHCTAQYPTEYFNLNLKFIEILKKEFPDAIIGYSGHDNGILAPTLAYMLGAVVFEKHFTLNHSWKGTDHKYSLEPEGLRKQIRDLKRVDISLGNGIKSIMDFENLAREKMGKSIYTSRNLEMGTLITENDIVFKTPAGGLPPYYLNKILGKKLKVSLKEEEQIKLDDLD
jgi:N-acetylneuraminate synthase/sialic acid synthase